MKEKLSQRQRLITAALYLITITLLYCFLNGGIKDILSQTLETNLWFFSGILLIIMGRYVTEPYFSSPTDTFTNSVSLAIVLYAVPSKTLVLYYPLLIFTLLLVVLSLLHIIFKNTNEKFKNISYWILKNVGSSTVIYSLVYLLSAYSFFAKNNMPLFICALTIWICIVFFDVYGKLVIKITTLLKIIRSTPKTAAIGFAIKNTNKNCFTISIPKTEENVRHFKTLLQKVFIVKTDSNTYTFSVATKADYSIDNILLELVTITDNEHPIDIQRSNLQDIGLHIQYDEVLGAVHEIQLANLTTDLVNRINKTPIYAKQDLLLGFVLPDSNINIIKFSLDNGNRKQIKEGSIVSVRIFEKDVLYQVINGITKTDTYGTETEAGYICCIARKLGIYDYSNNSLASAKWTPASNEGVYLCTTKPTVNYQEIANSSIGRLPESDMKIPLKDINSLVTHNTAILGILGVGKSCLTFELIKKLVENDTKIICIDITNQYASANGLYKYIDADMITNDFTVTKLKQLEDTALTKGTSEDPNSWGNQKNYEDSLYAYFNAFLQQNSKKVFVLNPDKHSVKKAATSFKISALTDVSLVEKTKIISEQLLKVCMEMGQTDTARCCLVFEEAHSLTPEWNSIVVSGDDKASNGTAKVILQGRKYGLGCILITQRTANVTKSILNQCNTIFALRVFDDTGKTFLENYIGKDYSDTLPTLEERHAIVTGKGLGLKQPVIIQLNDMKYLIHK